MGWPVCNSSLMDAGEALGEHSPLIAVRLGADVGGGLASREAVGRWVPPLDGRIRSAQDPRSLLIGFANVRSES